MSLDAQAQAAPPGAATDPFTAGGEMAGLMRAKDWGATPLGAQPAWPKSLQTVIRIMLTSRYAMWMGWGKDLSFFYNDAYAPTLGLKHAWALGAPANEVWAEIWHAIGPRIDSVLATGRATWDEGLLLFLERSGFPEETYHTFSYSPLADDDGATSGMLCVVTEETERVIGERRLASLRELAAALAGARGEKEVLDASCAALAASDKDLPFALVYLLGEDGVPRLVCHAGIDAAHPAAATALDGQAPWFLSAGESPGIAVVDDLPARFADLPTGAWQKAPIQAGLIPIPGQGQDGPIGYILAGLNPHRRYDDDYAGFLALIAGQIAAGLAGARAFEEERRRAAALAEIDRAKTLFFSNVSHEFRTPLTLMMSPLEDVLARPGEQSLAQAQPLLAIAHRNSLRLLRLVNTLLDFSRIEAGRVQARFEPTDLAALTADLASNFRAACEKAGLILDVACPPLAEPVHVDRQMWEKIVLNLISNAFKFTLDGSISVSLGVEGEAAVLRVADTGLGIPEADLARIFERFHRVEGQNGRTHEGTGIGLALVRELVALHGGQVGAESRPGGGAVFSDRIPLGSAHLHRDQIGQGPAAPGQAPSFVEEALRWLPSDEDAASRAEPAPDANLPHAAQPAAASRARIVLADDNADMRDYVRRLLATSWEVEAVPDGEAALAAARRRPPDLILSDVMMPRLDGFGLLRELREDAALRTTPVILLSARAGEDSQVEAFQAGADDYLVKPFSARELIARVRSTLETARIRREVADAISAHSAELEAVLATVPTAVWFTRDVQGLKITGNPQASALLRMPPGSNPSLLVENVERPDHFRVFRNGVEESIGDLPIYRAVRGEDVRNVEQEIRFGDGTSRVVLTNATPLRDAAGAAIGAVAAAIDISERKQAEEARSLLIDELNHRVKNTLATVQSIAGQSFRHAEDLAEARESFTARLLALSRAHDVLTRESWIAANLREVVAMALSPFLPEEGRVAFAGPEMRLTPKEALALSMGLHELATNAAKYGALSTEGGRIDLRWHVGEGADEDLHLIWRESGGPLVSPPRRRGFGSRLIEHGLAQELGGDADLAFEPDGLVCRITATLQAGRAARAAEGGR